MELTTSRLIYPDAPSGLLSGYCSICGQYDITHFHRNDLLTPTSANLTSIFDFHHEHVCRFCSAIWREPKKYHRAIYADHESVLFPVISAETASSERPLWADVIRQMPTDRERVIVLTTDPKKRVWPFARISSGNVACIYLHDPSRGVSGNTWVEIARLRECLVIIEEAYELGFSKPAIEESLFTSYKQLQAVGLATTTRMEKAISSYRATPEFLPALIVAQRKVTL
jgi:hypothetical protein